MKTLATAPSNIALIKYMGKTSTEANVPTNSSLSFTLEKLRSFVQITKLESGADLWRPLQQEGLCQFEMSEKGRVKFLNHFQKLKTHCQIEGSFLIESGNDFPSDCGLASSASSFAALTLAAFQMFEMIDPKWAQTTVLEKAQLSAQGSGSSCRSFFGPFSIWFSEGVRPIEFPISQLGHQVILVEQKRKAVSSSEAHQRVLTSELFDGRPVRAEKRLAELIVAFRGNDWKKAFEITWAEFWDMHALFETSSPNFGYMLPESLSALRFVENIWKTENDGPLVTMDAGANVHLLYRPDQTALMARVKKEFGELIL
jgi:diphosphomevalonate decarboxylase